MSSGGQAWPSHRKRAWPFSSRKAPPSDRRSSEQRSGDGTASPSSSMLCCGKIGNVTIDRKSILSKNHHLPSSAEFHRVPPTTISSRVRVSPCPSVNPPPPHQWDEAGVQQQLGVLHAHGHDGQPLVGAVVVVRGQLRAAHQGGRPHQAVHVHREHLHGLGQDQLGGGGGWMERSPLDQPEKSLHLGPIPFLPLTPPPCFEGLPLTPSPYPLPQLIQVKFIKNIHMF